VVSGRAGSKVSSRNRRSAASPASRTDGLGGRSPRVQRLKDANASLEVRASRAQNFSYLILKVVAASGAAEQFRRYGTSGLMPGARRVRTSSSATRISLMLLSWETRRITLKAWSASTL
jgi:hypothetical protein